MYRVRLCHTQMCVPPAIHVMAPGHQGHNVVANYNAVIAQDGLKATRRRTSIHVRKETSLLQLQEDVFSRPQYTDMFWDLGGWQTSPKEV